jgi:uncharacterized protein with ParB-like and HNH nuclease domain
MNVEALLRDIENKDLVLPEFQRGFVWKEDDIKKYIQSIYKKYPTGSLLKECQGDGSTDNKKCKTKTEEEK